jgi:ketosteroid isomerase-like protein
MFVSCRRLTVLAGLTAIVGCRGAQPAVDLTAEAQAVRDASMAWLAADQAKDWATAAATFAANGIAFYPPVPLVGPAAIRAFYETSLAKMPDFSVSWTVDTVMVAASGDMAVLVGSYVLSDAGKELDRGKFVTTWRKVDGVWKATTDMNMSMVPPVADTTAVKKPATNQP